MNWVWRYERQWNSAERDLRITFELGILPVLALVAVIVLLIWRPWS